MTAFALISGRLQSKPMTRPTKTGGRVTFFKLRVADGSATQFWDIATFSDAVRDELDGLTEGTVLSAVGQLAVSTFQWNGETRLSLKIIADRILPLKAPPVETRARCRAPRAELQPFH
jgi:hypothetical protein